MKVLYTSMSANFPLMSEMCRKNVVVVDAAPSKLAINISVVAVDGLFLNKIITATIPKILIMAV